MARRAKSAIRTTVLNAIGNASFAVTAEVNDLIAAVHREFGTNYAWSFRKRETQIQTSALVTGGTVTATQGSSLMTGVGTAFTGSMVGSAIRIPGVSTFFFIQGVSSATQLTLGDADGNIQTWPAPTASAVSYTIFKHQYQVPANMAILLWETRDWGLEERTIDEFDSKDPQRTSTGTPFQWAWARAQISTANVESRFIELWPVPSVAQVFRAGYLLEPPDLTADANIPIMPSELIECETIIRMAANLLAKTGDTRWAIVMQQWTRIRDGDQRTAGLLENCLFEDQKRWSLPRGITDGYTRVGYDLLSSRDWDVV